MRKTPQQELDEFLASKPTWMQKALQLEYSRFTIEENLEWINNQALLNREREEFERILRKSRAKWNAYCKRFSKLDAELAELERKLAGVPKGLPGAPRTDHITLDAVALEKSGLSFKQIADRLTKSKKYSKRYETAPLTADAVRKRIERYNAARTKFEK